MRSSQKTFDNCGNIEWLQYLKEQDDQEVKANVI